MDQAAQQGILFIDGSGPTYATATVSKITLCVPFFFLELVDFYRHAVLDTVSPPSSRYFTGPVLIDATISVIDW
jgi:hypothetical protein